LATDSYKKPDFWSKKAFTEGYPARSVYKLQEMDKKFGLLRPGLSILDLGAAPGSWTTYLLRTLGENTVVTAVDLSPLDTSVIAPNLTFFQGDIYSPAIREKVGACGPFDLVVCDVAPATTGNRILDTTRSEALAELALLYAELFLSLHGKFIVKIFQGGGEQALLKRMRTLFKTARGFKPEACRSSSFETYLVGLEYKKP